MGLAGPAAPLCVHLPPRKWASLSPVCTTFLGPYADTGAVVLNQRPRSRRAAAAAAAAMSSSTPERAASHARRQALPRRSTKGPLDAGADPLSQEQPIAPPVVVEAATTTTTTRTANPDIETNTDASPATLPLTIVEQEQKDFRFLLRPDIFQPLSHGDLPASFRKALEEQTTAPIEELLSHGLFRQAATAAADDLKFRTTPTDHARIFYLYYTRLVCLQLLGLHYQAAQESRALQDFNGAIFRNVATGIHVAPWELRLLVIRLQAIGFNDWRRGIMTYYELGREARFRGSKGPIEQRDIWQARLQDIEVRVGNALVEMGDHDGAARHLQSLATNNHDVPTAARLALVYLRIGNIQAAKDALDQAEGSETTLSLLKPLNAMADGDYAAAAAAWTAAREAAQEDSVRTAITQNLAVCLVYEGHMEQARSLLEEQVDAGSFEQSITFNLATIYELASEHARDLKVNLAGRAAAQTGGPVGWEKSNVDFKL